MYWLLNYRIKTGRLNSIEANFLTFIEKFDLIQKIDFHTAATGILDLFFVSQNIQVTDICKFQNVNSFTKMSNHYPIKTKFHVEISCGRGIQQYATLNNRNVVDGQGKSDASDILLPRIQMEKDIASSLCERSG